MHKDNERKIKISPDELELTPHSKGDKFEAQFGAVSSELGMTRLGCRYTFLPPGKRAWPKHAHTNNDEMFIILDGKGILKEGDNEYPIKAGDIIGSPAGGVETAHQLIAHSECSLTYLAVSSMLQPDFVLFPDSDKYAVFVGAAPGSKNQDGVFRHIGNFGPPVDYWEREDTQD